MSLKLDDVLHTRGFAADPFPTYRRLQAEEPVQWSQTWNCWVITGYDDARACLQDFKRFSNVGRITGLFHRHFDAAQLAALGPLIDHYSHGLINIDPPDHTRIRRLMHEVFRPTVITRLKGHVQEFVDDLLRQALPSGRLDVVHALAHPLPVQVIAELFGVPRADVPLFIRWSAGIVEFMKSPVPTFAACQGSQTALLEFRAYLRAAIAARRTQPRDDVLTHLVQARSEGESLTDDDILGTSVSILLGGHETTTRLMTTTLLELARHPEQRERLQREPELMETAVEEFLRYAGPFHRDQRVALVDTELGGKTIRQGQFILLMLAAANRDPRQFPDPEAFDLARRPNRHLTFGFGPHICLGAPLARLEMAVAVQTLLAATTDWRVANEPLEWDFGFLRGPRELTLEFTPLASRPERVVPPRESAGESRGKCPYSPIDTRPAPS